MKTFGRFLFIVLCVFISGCAVREWHSISDRAESHYRQGNYAEAALEAEKALELAKEDPRMRFMVGKSVVRLTVVLQRWAIKNISTGNFTEAETILKKDQSIIEENLGKWNYYYVSSLMNLGISYASAEKLVEAEDTLRRAQSLAEVILKPKHYLLKSDILENLGFLYQKQLRYAEAEEQFKRAYEVWENMVGPYHREMAAIMERLIGLYEESGNSKKAQKLIERTTKIWSETLKANERIEFDDRKWRIGQSGIMGDSQTVIHYVLPGETVFNWTELITFQSFQGTSMTPEQLLFKLTDDKSISCPDSNVKMLEKEQKILKNEEEILYEAILRCPGRDEEHNIVKLIQGSNALHVIHYATKHLPISEEDRNKWIELIEKATLKEFGYNLFLKQARIIKKVA